MADEIISSAANPRIKALSTLRRKGSSADDPRILIDGRREIGRAMEAGLRIDELYYCPALLEGAPSDEFPRQVHSRGACLTQVAEHVFEKIRYGDRTGGLVATALRPHRTIDGLKLSACPLLAVVDHVGKPGNLGAILRSADGAGVEAVLVADSIIDVYGPNVIRASIGTIFSVPVVELTAEQTLAYLRQRGLQIVAAAPDGAATYTQIDFRRPTALVFGSEDRGLTAPWSVSDVRTAKVPMRGIADSLNVATTAALFFYEALRQRSEGIENVECRM